MICCFIFSNQALFTLHSNEVTQPNVCINDLLGLYRVGMWVEAIIIFREVANLHYRAFLACNVLMETAF